MKRANGPVLILTPIFVYAMSFLTYCELRLSLFVYSPIYLGSVYYISLVQKEISDKVVLQVDDEFKNFVESKPIANTFDCMIIVFACLMLKYFQQLDFCRVLIQKWTS